MARVRVDIGVFQRAVEVSWAVDHATPWLEVPDEVKDNERTKMRAVFAAIGVAIKPIGESK